MIETLTDPAELRKRCDAERALGRRVGLVPTMGFLHRGHVSLMERCLEVADFLVVSIFVNPKQFGPNEDLDRYPRDAEGDRQKCEEAGAHVIFAPSVAAVYPEGHRTTVSVADLGDGLCGAKRPGHFDGVCTIVAKLFNLVGPSVAVFGAKDYQQLQIIRQMTQDLDMPIEVLGSPTIREADGLAMSSRNAYLTEEQRRQATCLNAALQAVQEAARVSPVTADHALALATEVISREKDARIDYIEIRHSRDLQRVDALGGGESVVALAVFFGTTRLIDNRVI